MQIHGENVRFGVHSGQQYATFGECAQLWRRAEELGFDWASIFDHFRPMDRPDGPCFEGTALLAALAATTTRIRCAMLVLGVPYRHPAIVASIASTIDHISNGRLELGLGAGAPDLSQQQFGLPFPSITDRMNMLDETCRIVRSLWTRQYSDFEGQYYQLRAAQLEPKPVQRHLPLVIGGAGERRMLRIVAEHADIWNTFSNDPAQYRQKLEVLGTHCDAVGRDRASIRQSLAFRAILRETEQEAQSHLDVITNNAPADSPARQGWFVVGTPEQCVERLRPFVELGVRDFLLGMRTPLDWHSAELFIREVAPAVRTATEEFNATART